MSAAESIVFVNDQPRGVAAGATLRDLLDAMGMADRRGIAVAVNGSVVARGLWPARALAASDRVLVIRATQGG